MVDLSLNSSSCGNGLLFPYYRNVSKMLERVCAQLLNLSFSPDKEEEKSIFHQKIDHICKLADACCKILVAIAYFSCQRQPSIEEQSAFYQIVQSLPAYIEDVWNLLRDENLAKMRETEEADKLAVARTKMTQTALYLSTNFYQAGFVSNERRFRIAFDNLNKTEFIIRLDDELNLQGELSKLLSKQICTEQQFQLAVKALEEAYEQKRRRIKQTLARQRILQFIGYPKEKHIADQIEQLAEIMSDLSKQQLHLCLRHFGYDLEQTLAALCERNQLPLDLKILLRNKDTLEDVTEGRRMAPFCDGQLADAYEIGYTEPGEIEKGLKNIGELVDLLAVDEATVAVNGKVLIRRGPHDRAQSPTPEERQALVEASLTRVNQMELEEEEGQGYVSSLDEEEEVAARAYLSDLRLEQEVGQSGRFNRLQALADNILYEDEYDDTFEPSEAYSEMGLGLRAASLDEKEAPTPNEAVGQRAEKKTAVDQPTTSSKVTATESTSKKVVDKKAAAKVERRVKEQNKGRDSRKAADKKRANMLQ